MLRALLFSLVIFSFGTAFTANAQFGVNNTASIQSIPRFPEPNETVALSLDAYSIDTTGAKIEWYLDGILNPDFTNSREIKIIAGALGETKRITARISQGSGAVINVELLLTPAEIDIILEPYTLTPVLYEGRALPSIGSRVRAIAIPNTIENKGPKEYSYTWHLNDKVLGGGSLRGAYIQEFVVPLDQEAILKVDVTDSNGVIVASESIILPHVDPEIHFYQDNPLRGPSRVAILNEILLIPAEVDVRAEPYYMDLNIFNLEPLLEWSIGGKKVTNPSQDQQVITLRKNGATGSFNIDFHIRNLKQFLQGAQENFVLHF